MIQYDSTNILRVSNVLFRVFQALETQMSMTCASKISQSEKVGNERMQDGFES